MTQHRPFWPRSDFDHSRCIFPRANERTTQEPPELSHSFTLCPSIPSMADTGMSIATLSHVIDEVEDALGSLPHGGHHHHHHVTPAVHPLPDDLKKTKAAQDDGSDANHSFHKYEAPHYHCHSSVSDDMSMDDPAEHGHSQDDGGDHEMMNTFSSSRSRDLTSLDPQMLRRHLTPVIESLDALDAEAVLGLERTTESWMGPARLNDTVQIVPIHDLITPRERNRGYVRYLHLTEKQDLYSIGVFVFPPGATIPLHDHPGMCVLSRVLYGEVTAKSFDLVVPSSKGGRQQGQNAQQSTTEHHQGSNSVTGRTASWLSSLFRRSSSTSTTTASTPRSATALPKGSMRAKANAIRTLRAPAATMLLPEQGNAHEFTAGPDGAAVLDVLLPPYDFDHDRDCTFYRTEYDDDSGVCADGGNCWLIPIEQPSDFHCISGQYGNVGAADDDEEEED